MLFLTALNFIKLKAMHHFTEAYSEPYQTLRVGLFDRIWQGSKYAYVLRDIINKC